MVGWSGEWVGVWLILEMGWVWVQLGSPVNACENLALLSQGISQQKPKSAV
jgi:hypothetical protein